jgi:hypothetical protein
LTAILSMTAALAVPSTAGAQSRDDCIASYEASQTLRQAGKVVAAREKLLICALPTCAEIVRKDCNVWLREVENALPSVVIRARDPEGRDSVDVKVWVDDTLFLDQLDGRSKPIDPGVHTFRFKLPGEAPVQQRIVINEGEKSRIISVGTAIPPPTSAITTEETSAPSSSGLSPSSYSPSTRTTVGYVLSGVGVVGLGAFSYFGWKGLSDRNDLRDTCYPKCSPSSVDHVRSQFLIADVSLGIGIAGLAVGSWLLLTRPPAAVKASTRVDMNVGASGVSASFQSTF